MIYHGRNDDQAGPEASAAGAEAAARESDADARSRGGAGRTARVELERPGLRAAGGGGGAAALSPDDAQVTKWFTVCGPSSAWIKTWDGHTNHDGWIGSAERAESDAKSQARDRIAMGLGRHFVEVRTYWGRNDLRNDTIERVIEVSL